MKEVDLYQPVKDLFIGLGYNVRAEVHDMDLVAIKESEMVVVELKTSFNLKLILQATQRQKLVEKVYIAIPAPSGRKRFSKSFKEYEHLIKRLELGLILVYLNEPQRAMIIFEPKEYLRNRLLARNRKKRLAALYEAENRHDYNNVGGTNGKIVTVYREKALLVAFLLYNRGKMTVKQLREETADMKVQPLLQNNHYGWFTRLSRGVYTISETGKEALEDYHDVVVKIKQDLSGGGRIQQK